MSNALPFGGPLGSFVDPLTGRAFPARVSGTALFDGELEREMLAPARKALVEVTGSELRKALAPGVNLLSFVKSPALAAAVGTAASVALGRPVRIDGAMIVAFIGADDHEVAAAVAVAAPAPAGPKLCTSCNAPAPGKFCASCGAAQNVAPPPVAAAPSKITPKLEPRFLAFPVGQPMAAGTQIEVPPIHCFVGFARGAIACNLQAGNHALASPCEAGVFISLSGLPFDLEVYVSGRGRMALHGALYMQDPVVAFRFMQQIDASILDMLAIVLGRVADRVSPTAADERQLCYGVAQLYPKENEAFQGVTLHLESMRPLAE